MDNYAQKTLTTKRGYKYTYYVSPTGEATKAHPALFFIHGFPDSARLWQDVVADLSSLPNKIIVPDALGYAGTDKPTDTAAYSYTGQATDLAEILRAEATESAIIIGHDWGSAIAQRTYLHLRELFAGMILLNVAYLPPPPASMPFNLDAVNAYTEQVNGNPQYAYWELFTAPDGPEIINARLERFWQVLHGDVDEWMLKLFCKRGAMKEFLLGTDDVPLLPYAEEARWKDKFMEQFQRDGIEGAVQMYKATVQNFQFESDQTIPRDKLVIEVPLLFIGCSRDAVCRPEAMEGPKKAGLVPDLKEVLINSAHWVPMEKPAEVAQHIKDWVTERFP